MGSDATKHSLFRQKWRISALIFHFAILLVFLRGLACQCLHGARRIPNATLKNIFDVRSLLYCSSHCLCVLLFCQQALQQLHGLHFTLSRSNVGQALRHELILLASRTWNLQQGHQTLLGLHHGLGRKKCHLVVLQKTPEQFNAVCLASIGSPQSRF